MTFKLLSSKTTEVVQDFVMSEISPILVSRLENKQNSDIARQRYK